MQMDCRKWETSKSSHWQEDLRQRQPRRVPALATMLCSRWLVCQAEEPAPGMLLHENPHVEAHSKLIKTKTEQESRAKGGPSCVKEWRRPLESFQSTLSGLLDPRIRQHRQVPQGRAE